MIDKAIFSIPIIIFLALTFQNIVCEDIPIIGEKVNVTDLEIKIERLDQMILQNEQMMVKMISTHESTILEMQEKISAQDNEILKMQKVNEDLQRMAESHAKSIGDQKHDIEHMNASVWSNDKYGCSESDVVFAANINLGSEYFLPVGAPVTSYNQIPINVGDHFDGYMGTFEAPHSGAYEFWMDAKIVAHKHAWIDIRVNGVDVKQFSSGIWNAGGDADVYGLHGNAVISLSAYDIVDLYVPYWDDPNVAHAICGHSVHYFMFAGRSL